MKSGNEERRAWFGENGGLQIYDVSKDAMV